jgi:hypothetical protein
VWRLPLGVHSDSDPAFGGSRRTDWSANAVELAEDQRVGKWVDGLAVAIVAERQSPHDDAGSVLRLSIPAAAIRFPRSPREREDMSIASLSRKTGFSPRGSQASGSQQPLACSASRVSVVWCRRPWKVDVDRRTLPIERYR